MSRSIVAVSTAVLAGFDDSTHSTRTRFGWSARISSARVFSGSKPPMYSNPVISDRSPLDSPHSGISQECKALVPGRPKFPVTRYSSFSR